MENDLTDFNPIQQEFVSRHEANDYLERIPRVCPPPSVRAQEKRKKEARERFRLALRIEALGIGVDGQGGSCCTLRRGRKRPERFWENYVAFREAKVKTRD